MQRDDFLRIIERDGMALLAAAERAPGAPVRACPGWDMGDLVWHAGEVHDFWATMVEKHLTDPREYDEPERPAAGDLAPWAHDRLENVLRVLRDTDPGTEVWTWSTGHNAAWVTRRMAHETIIHRYDAEVAAGLDAVIDPAEASDGVDEYLSFFLGDDDVEPGSVHLHATDVAGEWLVQFGSGSPRVTREHAKGDAAMRGTAADLILALWQRVPLSQVDVIGDTTAIDRLLTVGNRD